MPGSRRYTVGLRPRARAGWIGYAVVPFLLFTLLAPVPRAVASSGVGSDTEASIDLPKARHTGDAPVEQALAERRSVRAFAPTSLSLAAIAQLLWAAQGITDARGLRTAPSAGALYPLEIHLVAGAVDQLEPGTYRYDTASHRLLLTQRGDRRAEIARAAHGQDWIAEAPIVLVIAAVHERTQRKYGDRAPRYVHMEVGHAAQNVYLQSVSLGLGTTMVGAFDDARLARVLGLPAREKPLGILPVGRPR